MPLDDAQQAALHEQVERAVVRRERRPVVPLVAARVRRAVRVLDDVWPRPLRCARAVCLVAIGWLDARVLGWLRLSHTGCDCGEARVWSEPGVK